MIYNEGTHSKRSAQCVAVIAAYNPKTQSHMLTAKRVVANGWRHCFLRKDSWSCPPPRDLSPCNLLRGTSVLTTRLPRYVFALLLSRSS
jgi:hypothetical protein